jgi:HSP90 family molecular chaperone
LNVCDKIIYKFLKNAKVHGEQKELKIYILSDKENKHISIKDAGSEMKQFDSFQILEQLQD